jgi:hypothetical protein
MNLRPLALLPCLLLANCATIVSKSQYPVSVSSNPAGATVKVKNTKGEVIHQATTPTLVTLKSSSGYFQPAKYEFEFSRKGQPAKTVEVTAGLNGWYFGNVVFGGLIGLAFVDPATGAMWRLDEKVEANLTPMATLDAGDGRKLQLVDRKAVPAELEHKLVAMN